MLNLFVNVVLPVFIVAGFGFLLERRLHPPVLALNQTVLFVLMPAFVFTSLLSVDFRSEEPPRITAFALGLAISMLIIAFIVSRLARLDRVTTSALMLTAAFPNLGNYGLPVVLLAFGQPGLIVGTLLFAVQQLYGLTLAVFIASSSNTSLGRALREVFRQPILYAVVAALVLNFAGIAVPPFLQSALALPAQAAVPMMLLVLGMNIAGTTGIQEPRLVSLAVITRLVVGTLVGWLLVTVLGVAGVTRDVLIVGAAMPTAVFTILTATQFGTRPRFVSDVVVASTIASMVTITLVLTALKGSLAIP
jgi:predicted permease